MAYIRCPSSRNLERYMFGRVGHYDPYQSQVTFGQSPAGPIAKAKEDGVAALRRTVERLEHAMYTRDRGLPIPHDADEAMERFFKGTGFDKLEELRDRIKPLIEWLPNIPIRVIPTPVPAGTPYESFHNFFIGQSTPGAACPPNKCVPANHCPQGTCPTGQCTCDAGFIALYPTWFKAVNAKLQAAQLIHEAFHYSYLEILHGPSRWHDAFAYQGLVSVLGGLSIGNLLSNRFPKP
jgi:hypothetical protein